MLRLLWWSVSICCCLLGLLWMMFVLCSIFMKCDLVDFGRFGLVVWYEVMLRGLLVSWWVMVRCFGLLRVKSMFVSWILECFG